MCCDASENLFFQYILGLLQKLIEKSLLTWVIHCAQLNEEYTAHFFVHSFIQFIGVVENYAVCCSTFHLTAETQRMNLPSLNFY